MYDYLRLEVPKAVSVGIAGPARTAGLRNLGTSLEGDGLHPVRLYALTGRLERESPAGQNLSFSDLPRSTWLARCGTSSLPIVLTGR